MKDKNGIVIYEGTWKTYWEGSFKYIGSTKKHDYLNGYVEVFYSNNSFYKGFWKNNLKDGQGKRKYADGDVYKRQMEIW